MAALAGRVAFKVVVNIRICITSARMSLNRDRFVLAPPSQTRVGAPPPGELGGGSELLRVPRRASAPPRGAAAFKSWVGAGGRRVVSLYEYN